MAKQQQNNTERSSPSNGEAPFKQHEEGEDLSESNFNVKYNPYVYDGGASTTARGLCVFVGIYM